MDGSRSRETAAGLFLCALLCYSSSGGNSVYCWGQGPWHMFTGSLRRAIVVKVHPLHAVATLKIISNRAPLPWGQEEPVLTRFISLSHRRTFKTHFEIQDKTSSTLGYLPWPPRPLIYSPKLMQNVVFIYL